MSTHLPTPGDTPLPAVTAGVRARPRAPSADPRWGRRHGPPPGTRPAPPEAVASKASTVSSRQATSACLLPALGCDPTSLSVAGPGLPPPLTSAPASPPQGRPPGGAASRHAGESRTRAAHAPRRYTAVRSAGRRLAGCPGPRPCTRHARLCTPQRMRVCGETRAPRTGRPDRPRPARLPSRRPAGRASRGFCGERRRRPHSGRVGEACVRTPARHHGHEQLAPRRRGAELHVIVTLNSQASSFDTHVSTELHSSPRGLITRRETRTGPGRRLWRCRRRPRPPTRPLREALTADEGRPASTPSSAPPAGPSVPSGPQPAPAPRPPAVFAAVSTNASRCDPHG